MIRWINGLGEEQEVEPLSSFVFQGATYYVVLDWRTNAPRIVSPHEVF